MECVGYATVLINKEKEEIETLFGDTSKICATLHGEYKIQKPDLTQVFINQKGMNFERYILEHQSDYFCS